MFPVLEAVFPLLTTSPATLLLTAYVCIHLLRTLSLWRDKQPWPCLGSLGCLSDTTSAEKLRSAAHLPGWSHLSRCVKA